MVCRNNTSHSSFSMTVITVLVVTAGALLFASCATSPRSEAGSSEAGSSKTATDEKTTPSEPETEKPEKTEKTATTTPENGEAEAPGSDEAAAAPAAAEPPSRTQRHIQHLEDGLKPLRSIPSRRD